MKKGGLAIVEGSTLLALLRPPSSPRSQRSLNTMRP